jgi:hypothetical protein
VFIDVTIAGVVIRHLSLLEVMTFVLSIAVAFAGLVTGLLARRIWRMVDGELAASWGFVLPGFAVYLFASGLRVLSVFFSKHEVYQLVRRVESFATPQQLAGLIMPLQSLTEMAFLGLIVVGLIKQHRLFASLALRGEND